MPKKKEEPEVAAAVETTESAAEVTDIARSRRTCRRSICRADRAGS